MEPSRVLLLAVLLFAPLAATGCLTASAPSLAAPDLAPEEAAPATGIARDACRDLCFEPSIAVDSAGRVFLTTVSGDGVAVSEDGGASFVLRDGPPAPSGAPPRREPLPALTGYQGHRHNGSDATLATGPDGSLYYVAFDLTGLGIHVARSDDGAQHWLANTYLALPLDARGAGRVDRPWLGFGRDGTVLLSFSWIPSGVWLARSDDRAATFGEFTRVGAVERGVLGGAGAPTMDEAGRVYLPFLAGPPITALGDSTVNVAVSVDRGTTFTSQVLGGPPPLASPMLATRGDGRAALAYLGRTDGDARILVSTTIDAGKTWAEPVAWSDEEAMPVVPAIAWDAKRLAVAWFTSDGSLRLSWEEDGTRREATFDRSPTEYTAERPAGTDVATLALSSRAWTAWWTADQLAFASVP